MALRQDLDKKCAQVDTSAAQELVDEDLSVGIVETGHSRAAKMFTLQTAVQNHNFPVVARGGVETFDVHFDTIFWKTLYIVLFIF